MGTEHYIEARKRAQRAVHSREAKHLSPYLPVLSEIVPDLSKMPQIPVGLAQIDLTRIVGTVTSGRTNAFAHNFMPLLDTSTEFSSKWATLYDEIVESGLRDPIIVYEYYNDFYVLEGNKRVSVMRSLDSVVIEANVTRILPQPEETVRYRVYQEFLQYNRDTALYAPIFSHEGSYARLYKLAARTPGEKWSEDDVRSLHSAFYRFEQAYAQQSGPNPPQSAGDAFLLFISVYGFDACLNYTPSEFLSSIRRIWPEFIVAGANKPAAMIEAPSDKHSLLSSILRRPPQLLRCAFIYNSAPEISGWTYWHELGRKSLEELFNGQVETVTCANISPQEAEGVISQLVEDGFSVIFAASPILLDACIRQSVLHPEIVILNCSLLASYHNVRSYYLRIYEAKFILGAIAGAMAEDDRIGYIADYPIYGVPASINAFALGAQLTNPRAKIILDWSTLPEHDPEKALRDAGIRTVSCRDISAPHVESRAFGLYTQDTDGQITNLAMPVWNWGKLYQDILRSILSGGFNQDVQQNRDRLLSYYMGMNSGAIDIICSQRLPAGVSRLAELLKQQISSGSFSPLSGLILDQSGKTRLRQGSSIPPREAIAMDYLVSNVEGRLPCADELIPSAQSLVRLQGVRVGEPLPKP